MTGWPVPERIDPPFVPAERAGLDAWLDFHRATLLLKCAGLTGEQLVERACPPSPLSLLGLVRHMTQVEHRWFGRFDGSPWRPPHSSPEHPWADIHGPDPARADEDLRTHQAMVRASRRVVADVDLEAVSRGGDLDRPVSLRWIYLHMIEEYARHNGHADLLRERIDGVTGE